MFELLQKKFLSSFHTSTKLIKMKVKIWRVLAQILFYRNDLIETIKPPIALE